MFHRMRSRFEGSIPRQVFFSKLSRAAATAASTASGPPSGTVARQLAGGGIDDVDVFHYISLAMKPTYARVRPMIRTAEIPGDPDVWPSVSR